MGRLLTTSPLDSRIYPLQARPSVTWVCNRTAFHACRSSASSTYVSRGDTLVTVTLSRCRPVTLSPCPLSPCPLSPVTLSPSHPVPCHPVTLSPCHPVTLSSHRPYRHVATPRCLCMLLVFLFRFLTRRAPPPSALNCASSLAGYALPSTAMMWSSYVPQNRLR